MADLTQEKLDELVRLDTWASQAAYCPHDNVAAALWAALPALMIAARKGLEAEATISALTADRDEWRNAALLSECAEREGIFEAERDAAIARAETAERERDEARAETARWKLQSDDWQKRGWELGAQLDAAEARVAKLKAVARAALETVVMVIAFLGRDQKTDRIDRTIDGLVTVCVKTDATIREALKEDKS